MKMRDELISEAIALLKETWAAGYESGVEALRVSREIEQDESGCPYYVIDEDGHGLCNNHKDIEDEWEDKII